MKNFKAVSTLFIFFSILITGLGILETKKQLIPINSLQQFPFIPAILILIGLTVIIAVMALLEPMSPGIRKFWDKFVDMNKILLRRFLQLTKRRLLITVLLMTSIYLVLYLILNDVKKTVGFWITSVLIIFTSTTFSKINFEKIGELMLWVTKQRIFTDVFEDPKQWKLNHWGSKSARFEDSKMVFEGIFQNPQGEDGSHRDLMDILDENKKYQIVAHVKSDPGTTGQFRLWCHDIARADAVSASTEFEVPSRATKDISLIFLPKNNKNIRIHLQYKPGTGKIYVEKVEIYKLS